MGAVSAKRSSIKVFNKYNSALVGNPYTQPYTANFEHIATVSLSANQTSVSFTNLGVIAADYKHLQIRAVPRSDSSGVEYGQGSLTINGDSGANYAVHFLIGTGSSVSTYSAANATGGVGFVHAGNTAGASMFGANVMDILDFSSSTKFKTVRTMSGGVFGSTKQNRFHSSLWRSTTAITSIAFTPESGNWVSGSRFSLYGTRG